MKPLITGASGFVGQHLIKKFIERGQAVSVLTRSKNRIDTHPLISTVYGDITDSISLKKAFAHHDFVFHLAGFVGYSKKLLPAMVMTNVIGTQNVIEACKVHHIKKMFYMSSVAAIGASFSHKMILNEESPYNLSPLNLGYFETKKKAEEIVMEAHRSGVIEVFLANPSTIYGPADAEKGSRKNQIKVARGQLPFYPPGGVGVVHIDDVIDAIFKIIEIGQSGRRYILSSENLTIREVFNIIAKEAGSKAPWIPLPSWLLHRLGRIGDYREARDRTFLINSEVAHTATLYHWFNNGRMRKELQINPKPAAEAIRDSVQWMRQNNIL